MPDLDWMEEICREQERKGKDEGFHQAMAPGHHQEVVIRDKGWVKSFRDVLIPELVGCNGRKQLVSVLRSES